MSSPLGPNVNIDEFKMGVKFIRDSLNEGNAKFYFEPARTGIIFKRPPTKRFIREYGIEYENLKKIMDEILEITSIILSGEKNDIIANIGDNETVVETFKERCEIIYGKLITWNLIQRYYLQKNYKTSLLDKFDWDVIIKREKFEDEILTFPTAMLRIRTRKPFSEKPPVIKTETITLEAGLDEINSLIKELNKIKKELSEANKVG